MAIETLLPKTLSSTMSLTISSVSEEASLILMLQAVAWCGNFPCGAVIALPQGGWHRFVVPVAALSTPPPVTLRRSGGYSYPRITPDL